MDLTIFEAYIGTTCDVHMISDSVVMGEIKALTDRWIEVVSPHGTEIINAEYIEHIRVHKNKKK